jgi:hypothetical protein
MTVLLVLFTFITFLTIDYFRTRHAAAEPAAINAAHNADVPRLQPALVRGFEVPEHLRYHPGHTWALSESPSLVRVGMDDFASKLILNGSDDAQDPLSATAIYAKAVGTIETAQYTRRGVASVASLGIFIERAIDLGRI